VRVVSSKVGIILNPMAGRDVRRIVANAEFISLYLKINVTKRFILGLDFVGVDEVILMPDIYGLAEEVVEELRRRVSLKLRLIEMTSKGTVEDTVQAARLMKASGVNLIAGFGGDGTLRAIFKGAGVIPLLGIPLGTNNVLSRSSYEPSVLGILVGFIARGIIPLHKTVIPMKVVKLYVNGGLADTALIDLAFISESFVGAKAVWRMEPIKYIIYSKCEPTDVGLTSIGGNVQPITFKDDKGLLIELGPGYLHVPAVIAPGLIEKVPVKSFKTININERIEIPRGKYTIAFDGERELTVTDDVELQVEVDRSGPLLIDPQLILNELRAQHKVIYDKIYKIS
jgi:predicted polyphosphate/ATP-dependent NAD kinase